MKKIFFYLFISTAINAEVWRFGHFKDETSIIRKDFLLGIQQLFKASIFVETGTGGGATTERAAQVFNEVYSVEIQPDVFLVAQKRLQEHFNVRLYHEDSVKGLGIVTRHISPDKKCVFFLDAHYNGVEDGKGSKNTPIMEELDVIFSSQLNDPVIIIDDARMFKSQEEQKSEFDLYHCDEVLDYPHIKDVIAYIQQRRPHYKSYVYGDLIVSYAEHIEVSPLIKFMTDDMINNNVICYDFEKAQSRMPSDLTEQEVDAISFIFDSKILYGPILYHKTFEMWKCLISNTEIFRELEKQRKDELERIYRSSSFMIEVYDLINKQSPNQ